MATIIISNVYLIQGANTVDVQVVADNVEDAVKIYTEYLKKYNESPNIVKIERLNIDIPVVYER